MPLSRGEVELYRTIREAVPVVDAALIKIIRLTGGFEAVTPRAVETGDLREFLSMVPVGHGQMGIDAFVEGYLDSLLTCGAAVGEMALSQGARGLEAVLVGDVRDIEIVAGDSPLDFTLCVRRDGGLEPVGCPELVFFTPHMPHPDAPFGVSMLHGMPFLSQILLKIFYAMGQNWERMGAARYSVVLRPGGHEGDHQTAERRAAQMAREWSNAMASSDNGRVRDFVAVGDVDIKVIGADGLVLDSSVPVRQILEQLVARTGIPPFLLGLSWSSTERMSSQQADILTSELTALRRILTPVLLRIVHMWQRLRGAPCDGWIEWAPINLQDELQEARAAYVRAQVGGISSSSL